MNLVARVVKGDFGTASGMFSQALQYYGKILESEFNLKGNSCFTVLFEDGIEAFDDAFCLSFRSSISCLISGVGGNSEPISKVNAPLWVGRHDS